MSKKRLKITQIKSAVGKNIKDKRTLKALGIRRMHHTVVQDDSAVIRGMINSIPYLLKTEEIEE